MPSADEGSFRERIDVGVLTVIPPELDAARDALGGLQRVEKDAADDTVYWRGAVRSALRARDYSVILAGIGAAGTSSAAVLATQMVERYRPRVVLLVGIAAGMRGKVRIGEVVLCDRVVAYEPAAVVVGKDGGRTIERRPELTLVSHGIRQDTLNYEVEAKRLAALFKRIKGKFPAAPRDLPPDKREEWKEHVASSVLCKKNVTIASGDVRLVPCLLLLIDDADKLATTGNQFKEAFFEVVRGEVEDGRLVWVSTSRGDLYDVFRQEKLSSRLFQSTNRIWVNSLDMDSARRLAEEGPPEHVEGILREAGGFAYGLQWLGDRLVQRVGSADETWSAFRWEMKRMVFPSWWGGLRADLRMLLKVCAAEEGAIPNDEDARLMLRELVEQGYVVKNAGRYRVAPGEAWREFVLRAT